MLRDKDNLVSRIGNIDMYSVWILTEVYEIMLIKIPCGSLNKHAPSES